MVAREGQRLVRRAALARRAATSSRAPRSTSWRCGRPTPSTPPRSTASWAGPRAWASTASASSSTTCPGSRTGRLPQADRRSSSAIADKHKIGAMFVLFDACWDPYPKLGKQRAAEARRPQLGLGPEPRHGDPERPRPARRAGGLRQGRHRPLQGRRPRPRLGPLQRARQHQRSSYGKLGAAPTRPSCRSTCSARPSPGPARSTPSQPLTSGVWVGRLVARARLSPTDRLQLERVRRHLVPQLRPARRAEGADRRPPQATAGRSSAPSTWPGPPGARSTPSSAISASRRSGPTTGASSTASRQTIYPWDSWKKPYAAEPPVWFHDIFRKDGTPYDPRRSPTSGGSRGAAEAVSRG